MSIPVLHPWDNIFFFKLAFIPFKNIHYRPDSTRLNASSFALFTLKLSGIYQMFGDIWLDGSYEQRTLIGWADLNLFIDHAVKTKTNKMDHDLRVFEWTLWVYYTTFFHRNGAVWELGIHSLR